MCDHFISLSAIDLNNSLNSAFNLQIASCSSEVVFQLVNHQKTINVTQIVINQTFHMIIKDQRDQGKRFK